MLETASSSAQLQRASFLASRAGRLGKEFHGAGPGRKGRGMAAFYRSLITLVVLSPGIRVQVFDVGFRLEDGQGGSGVFFSCARKLLIRVSKHWHYILHYWAVNKALPVEWVYLALENIQSWLHPSG